MLTTVQGNHLRLTAGRARASRRKVSGALPGRRRCGRFQLPADESDSPSKPPFETLQRARREGHAPWPIPELLNADILSVPRPALELVRPRHIDIGLRRSSHWGKQIGVAAVGRAGFSGQPRRRMPGLQPTDPHGISIAHRLGSVTSGHRPSVS